ncbi:hypothetical protein M5F04_14970 [Acinetobacter sp. ANC 7200]|uniref:hypothetical protein n=1 Tax=Acinetobacter amyesii TaxID=2942470 RepID=UPI0020BEA151|nr:hypothetical protein [Acinetobacter amyesii]MCL6245836.1 hypothetical protein [Acinetobacter amyesii]
MSNVGNLKQDIIDLTEELRTRISFLEVKRQFTDLNFPSANSWGKLLENFSSFFADDLQDMLEELKSNLGRVLRAHLFYSDKSVSIYRDYQYLELLYENLDKGITKDPEELSFESHKILGDLEFFIYKTSRVFYEKVEIDINLFDNEYDNVQQAYAIKSITRECYDSIIFNRNKGYLILSLDRAELSNTAILNKARSKLVRKINDSIREICGDAHLKESGDNLFSAIEKFYHDDSGEVTSLAFLTLSGTSHHEKLHKTCPDVRQAVYHIAGSSATPIEPYRISIRYDLNDQHPEIFLLGSFRVMNSRTARQLFEARIQGATTRKSFEFCIDKIIKFIQR